MSIQTFTSYFKLRKAYYITTGLFHSVLCWNTASVTQKCIAGKLSCEISNHHSKRSTIIKEMQRRLCNILVHQIKCASSFLSFWETCTSSQKGNCIQNYHVDVYNKIFTILYIDNVPVHYFLLYRESPS